jgi:hypothetical protein
LDVVDRPGPAALLGSNAELTPSPRDLLVVGQHDPASEPAHQLASGAASPPSFLPEPIALPSSQTRTGDVPDRSSDDLETVRLASVSSVDRPREVEQCGQALKGYESRSSQGLCAPRRDYRASEGRRDHPNPTPAATIRTPESLG